MSGLNSHQLPAVPALVTACCQNCRCISTRLVLSVRDKCSVHQSRDTSLTYNQYDPRSLYGCATQLMLQIGKGQLCTIFHIPGEEQKGLAAFLCHRNSKKLEVKSRRRLLFFSKVKTHLKFRPSKNNTRTAEETTFSLALFTTESKNIYYLARLSKWIINLTNLDWNGNCRNKDYLAKYWYVFFFLASISTPRTLSFKTCNQSTFTDRE